MITETKDLSKAVAVTASILAVSIFCVASLGATAAFGQTTTVNSGSSSGSSSSATVTSTSGARASGGNSNAQIYLDQSGPSTIASKQEYTGSYTLRTAPAVQPPSMGSGHPCALASSIGISIIGGGAAGGLGRVDEACLLAQMGQGQAALLMIARRDQEACIALRQVGTIPSNSACSRSERRAAGRRSQQVSRQAATPTPVASVAQPRPISGYVRCSRREDGKILAQKRPGTPYPDTEIASYCRSQIK